MDILVRRAPSVGLTLAMILGLSTLARCNKPGGEQNGAALLNNDALVSNVALGNSAEALPPLPDALPLDNSAPAAAPKLAPSAAALPAAPPVPVARVRDPGQSYAYLDRAYGQSEAYGDAPPDYAFDYDGVSPWAWQAADNSMQYAEPVEGGYRYYYYEPGADYPYLVRDPAYSYGYSGGRLAVVYDDYGRVLDEREAYRRAPYAGRYLNRARELRAAASREQRRRINAENWAARRGAIADSRQRWERQRQQDSGWRDYSRRNDGQQADYWRAERERRQQEASRFAGWQREGFRGADPVRGDADAQRRRAEAIRDQQQRQAAIAQNRRDQLLEAQRQRRADQADRLGDRQDQQRDQRQRQIAEQQRDRATAARQQAQADQQRQREQAIHERQQATRQQQIDRQKQIAAARADAQRQDRLQAQQQRQQTQREQQQRAVEQRRQAAVQDRRDQQRQQAEQRQRDAQANAARQRADAAKQRADAVKQRQDAVRQQAEARSRAQADQKRQDATRQQADRQREQAQARADAARDRQQAAVRDRQEQARAQAQQRQQDARAQAQQRQQEARAQAQQRQQEARNRPEPARRQPPQGDQRPHD